MWVTERYKRNERGNVSMMFGVVLLALMASIGVAIDYTGAERAQKRLQYQVDAAVLAGATASMDAVDRSNPAYEKQQRTEAAIKVLSGNGYDTTVMPPQIDMTPNMFSVTAHVDYTPAFGAFIGRKSMRLEATSASGMGEMQPVEIALVLDNTGSMLEGNKMAALKTGAQNLVDAIERSNSGSKIAIVPFARHVRIEPEHQDTSWLDIPPPFDTTITWNQATHTGGSCVTESRTRTVDGVTQNYTAQNCTGQQTTYEEMTRVEESSFKNCIGIRQPPYHEIDGNYATKIPGLYEKIPYQHSGLPGDVWGWCPTSILPLTDDYETLQDKILAMNGRGQTYLPTGLIWGQRVLSPEAPFAEGDASEDTMKIMVLMTDGSNTAHVLTDQAAVDTLRAPPYIALSDAADQYAPQADAATVRMCNNVKADGIELYTIAFQVSDPATKTMLRNCASSPSKAFKAENNAALINSFEQISRAMEESVRLMH